MVKNYFFYFVCLCFAFYDEYWRSSNDGAAKFSLAQGRARASTVMTSLMSSQMLLCW